MKKALFFVVMAVNVLVIGYAQSALSGTYSFNADNYIIFTGRDFTGKWGSSTVSGTYSISGKKLTLRGIAGDLTIVDEYTIIDQNRFIYRKPMPTVEERLANGKKQLDQGSYDAAIFELTKAIELDPNMAEAYAYRARAYTSHSDYDRALADANSVINIHSKLAMGYFVRGDIYCAMGDYDRAIADYEASLKIDQNYPLAKDNLASARQAKLQRQQAQQQQQQAQQQWEQQERQRREQENTATQDGVRATIVNLVDRRATLMVENTTSQTKRIIIVFWVQHSRRFGNQAYPPLQNSPEYTLAPREKRNVVVPIITSGNPRLEISKIIVY